MTLLEILKLVLDVLLTAWQARRSAPDEVRIRAAAVATAALNKDRDAFRAAVANNDAKAMTFHFAELRDRVAALRDVDATTSEIGKVIELAKRKP